MKRLCLIGIVLCAAFAEQAPRQGPPQDVPVDIRPTREAIVKDDYKRNLQDAARLASLAEELKSELENGDKVRCFGEDDEESGRY